MVTHRTTKASRVQGITANRGKPLRWVFLVYRLPREPSTPRISVWRKLRRLGAAQLQDGLITLPLDSRNREQMEWIADEVIEAGGEAQIWLAESATAAQERALASSMTSAIDDEYRLIIAAAREARQEDSTSRLRTLKRLRKELARVRARDYFGTSVRDAAKTSVDGLARGVEVSR
jgi:hypothetical protein